MAPHSKVRLAVVDSHPIQYHCQYYKILASCPFIELTVLYCWDTRDGANDPNYGIVKWDLPLLDGYNYKFIRNISHSPGSGLHFFSFINPDLFPLLSHSNYDVLWVWGYSSLSAWLAVLSARLHGLRILFRGEATLDVPRSWYRRLLKELIIRFFLKMVNAVAFSCEANKRYFQYYGVKDNALIFAACAVDNAFFQSSSATLHPAECRKSLGLDVRQPVLLFVGSLVHRKRPFDLIMIVERLRDTINPALLFVGDGPLRLELEDYCRRNRLSSVHFLGFRNQSELAPIYAASSVLLVVSNSDPSPKVINEAMNFGLPVVVSNRVGTAGDLIIDGWNGYVVPLGDIDAMVSACQRLLTDPKLAGRFRQNALRQIDNWSFEKGASAIQEWLLTPHQ